MIEEHDTTTARRSDWEHFHPSLDGSYTNKLIDGDNKSASASARVRILCLFTLRCPAKGGPLWFTPLVRPKKKSSLTGTDQLFKAVHFEYPALAQVTSLIP